MCASVWSMTNRVRYGRISSAASNGMGHYWEFRRSAGQPGIVSVGYGFLAAALQSMTHGFIASFDGAWDEQRFPATADDFLSWYFRPEKAIDPEIKVWAERTLGWLRNFNPGPGRSNGDYRVDAPMTIKQSALLAICDPYRTSLGSSIFLPGSTGRLNV
jgi:hypothetical protein